MSSIAAVKALKEGDYTYTEKDWNDQAEAVVAAKGKETPPSHLRPRARPQPRGHSEIPR